MKTQTHAAKCCCLAAHGAMTATAAADTRIHNTRHSAVAHRPWPGLCLATRPCSQITLGRLVHHRGMKPK